MKKFAVIVAAGSGSRMNSKMPKQFIDLGGKPLLYYTINVFFKAFDDLQIILVLPKEYISKGVEIVNAYFGNERIQICEGGQTRFHSVKNGLSFIHAQSIIFVHDGVRCLLTADLIHRCFRGAQEYGSAIPVITSKDSVRLLTASGSKSLNRNDVKLVQTPQTFHSKILLTAFKANYQDTFTDEATVVEEFGLKINLIEGEESNIKITRPADLIVAEKLLLQ